MHRFAKYFLQGMVLVVPVSITLYVVWASINWIDNLIYGMLGYFMDIPLELPGLGLLAFLAIITLLGYVGSNFIAQSMFEVVEKILNRLPLVKLVYSSIKDLISAFVGDKKKFDQAVLVTMNKESGIAKLGFITQKNLAGLGLHDKVAVYLPHSYNFSGNLFIVPMENVTPLAVPGSDVMKFIVSGGVADIAVTNHSTTNIEEIA
jgi:uncharacterized membrane protein